MRTYALVRLDVGDYVCPSNDRTALWRFQRYEDGRGAGLDVAYEWRTFWAAWSVPMPAEADRNIDTLNDWADRPTAYASMFRTRAEAIAWAFRDEEDEKCEATG